MDDARDDDEAVGLPDHDALLEHFLGAFPGGEVGLRSLIPNLLHVGVPAEPELAGTIRLKRGKRGSACNRDTYIVYVDPSRVFDSLSWAQTRWKGVLLASWIRAGRVDGTGQRYMDYARALAGKASAPCALPDAEPPVLLLAQKASPKRAACSRAHSPAAAARRKVRVAIVDSEDSDEYESSPNQLEDDRPEHEAWPLGICWDDATAHAAELAALAATSAGGRHAALWAAHAAASATLLREASETFLDQAERAALALELAALAADHGDAADAAASDAELGARCRALFSSNRMAGPTRLPARSDWRPLRAVATADEALARIAAGEWCAQSGPLVLPASQLADLVAAGLRLPAWATFDDISPARADGADDGGDTDEGAEGEGPALGGARSALSLALSSLKRGSKLSVADLERGSHRTMAVHEVLRALVAPAEARTSLFNSITELGAGSQLDVAMPAALEAARTSSAYWTSVKTFLLLSMRGASMSYHLDLWATAVFYTVRWGCKVFAIAPPTAANVKLLRAWQRNGEPDSGETGRARRRAGDLRGCFPAGLEGMRVAVLGAGASLLIPSGWIHAVVTSADSCVFGFNFHTAAQLETALPLAVADWGCKTAEMQQTRAFSLAKLDTELWRLVGELVNKPPPTDGDEDEPAAAALASCARSTDAVARSLLVVAGYLELSKASESGERRGPCPRFSQLSHTFHSETMILAELRARARAILDRAPALSSADDAPLSGAADDDSSAADEVSPSAAAADESQVDACAIQAAALEGMSSAEAPSSPLTELLPADADSDSAA